MNRLRQLDTVQAPGETKSCFRTVKRKYGTVANAMRVLGNSPAALKGYLNLNEALARGALSTKLREQIALVVSEINRCAYCLSAHASTGEHAGLSQMEISAARFGTGTDGKSEAVLDLVWAIMIERGQIEDLDIEAARNVGLSDEEIVEVVANIALITLTNYLNKVANTVIDFPEVTPGVVMRAPEHATASLR